LRRVLYTEAFLARLEEVLGWYREREATAFCDRFVRRLFEEVEPRLVAFPGSGRPLSDPPRLARLAPGLLEAVGLPQTDLELREVVLEGHLLLYGYDDARIVFLFLKHGRQRSYG